MIVSGLAMQSFQKGNTFQDIRVKFQTSGKSLPGKNHFTVGYLLLSQTVMEVRGPDPGMFKEAKQTGKQEKLFIKLTHIYIYIY